MKIAYITNATDPNGGASKALLSLITELQASGIEPLVITPDREGIYRKWKDMGIRTIALNYRPCTLPPLVTIKDYIMLPLRTIGRVILQKKTAKRLQQILSEEKIQLIHSNTSVIGIGYEAARKSGIPHIWHIREYGDLDFLLHYIPSWKSHHKKLAASHTICITNGVQKHHGLSGNNKSTVIYDGVMPEQPERTDFHTPMSFFLFAGRIEPTKGLSQLLDGYAAYSKMTDNPLPLYVAGPSRMPHYMNEIKNEIKTYGIEDRIKFLGACDNIYEIMRSATAIVISSSFEGFGFCMTEAMFNGCLVIGRDTAGTKEQFDNGKRINNTEIGLRYSTTDELTKRLLEVTNSAPQEYEEMKRKAFNTVNALYTSENSARDVLELYKKCLTTAE